MVSVKSARQAESERRSNSSRKTASGRGRPSASRARETACGVTVPSPSATVAELMTSVETAENPMPRFSVCSAISPSAFLQTDEKSSPESQVARTVSRPLDASSSDTTAASEVFPTPRSP